MSTTSMDVTRELLTAREVARMIGAGERSVWRWSQSGRMPRPVRIGAAVRFRRADIEQWIAAGCPRCDEGSE